MNAAAAMLVFQGEFDAFQKTGGGRRPICDVRHAQWTRTEAHRLRFDITADRFLRNMVRAIVGTLIDIGKGRMAPEAMAEVIDPRTAAERELLRRRAACTFHGSITPSSRERPETTGKIFDGKVLRRILNRYPVPRASCGRACSWSCWPVELGAPASSGWPSTTTLPWETDRACCASSSWSSA